ncbi:unnamed protein product [Leuciscus chuanchicus]
MRTILHTVSLLTVRLILDNESKHRDSSAKHTPEKEPPQRPSGSSNLRPPFLSSRGEAAGGSSPTESSIERAGECGKSRKQSAGAYWVSFSISAYTVSVNSTSAVSSIASDTSALTQTAGVRLNLPAIFPSFASFRSKNP